MLNMLPEPGLVTRIALQSFRGSTGQVLTLDCQAHLILGSMPDTLLEDAYALDPARQLDTHLAAVAGKGDVEPGDAADDYVRRNNAIAARYPAHLVAAGLADWEADQVIRPSAARRDLERDGRHRLRPEARAPARLSSRSASVRSSSGPSLQRWMRTPSDASKRVERRAGPEASRFRSSSAPCSSQLPPSPPGLGADPLTIAVLLGVLILHELGHFFAMRAFGYRDTGIFFLPFFGAATTGRKRDASVTQEVVVLLMGPLPGLLLGLGGIMAHLQGLHLPGGPVATKAAWMLIVINYFNLLPLLPFDGGKIVQRLLFSRFPWLDVAFMALGARRA